VDKKNLNTAIKEKKLFLKFKENLSKSGCSGTFSGRKKMKSTF
jgi:hypothetical protein